MEHIRRNAPSEDQEPDRLHVGLKEISARLGRTESEVRNWLATKVLRVGKIGHRLALSEKAARRFISEHGDPSPLEDD